MKKINTAYVDDFFEDYYRLLKSYMKTEGLGEFSKMLLLHPARNSQIDFHQNKNTQPFSFDGTRSKEVMLRTQIDHAITFTDKVPNTKKHLKLLLALGKLSTQRGELSLSSDIYSRILFKTIGKKEYAAEKAYAYLGISRVFSYQAKWKESHAYAQQAKAIFEDIQNFKGRAEIENLIGTFYAEKGDLAKAKECLSSALKIIQKKKDTQLIAMIETNLGICNNIAGNYKSAEKYFKLALTKFTKLKDGKRIAENYHNMGMLFTKMKKYSEALRYFKMSIAKSKKANYLQTLAISYLASAFIYARQKNTKQASEYIGLSQSYSYYINDRLTVADIYKVKGIIEKLNKNFFVAESYLLTSLRINNELNNKLNYAETALELALLHRELGNENDSNSYLFIAKKYFAKAGAEEDAKEVSTMMN